MEKCYDSAIEFFKLINQLTREYLKDNFDNSLDINCDFKLYFILLESRFLPYNYNLFVEDISSCEVRFSIHSLGLVFRSKSHNNYACDIPKDYFIGKDINSFVDKGLDLRFANERVIIAMNKESALLRINELRLNNIKGLIKDIQSVEDSFSNDVKEILES